MPERLSLCTACGGCVPLPSEEGTSRSRAATAIATSIGPLSLSLYICLSVCLSVCLCLCLPVCLFVSLSLCLTLSRSRAATAIATSIGLLSTYPRRLIFAGIDQVQCPPHSGLPSDVWLDSDRLSVTLSVGPPLQPSSIVFRTAYGLSTFELFKKFVEARCVASTCRRTPRGVQHNQSTCRRAQSVYLSEKHNQEKTTHRALSRGPLRLPLSPLHSETHRHDLNSAHHRDPPGSCFLKDNTGNSV